MGEGNNNNNPQQVVVQPQAMLEMALHATTHEQDSVHGILLGRWDGNKLVVESAVPVSHGAPSFPMVDTALGLLQAETIVGWYTAPLLLDDTQAGPVALRMASNLDTATASNNNNGSVLIVVQNKALVNACCGGATTDQTKKLIQAYGKDFGNQFLEPISTTVDKADQIMESVLSKAVQEVSSYGDLMDHMDDPAATPDWYPNEKVAALVQKM